MFVLKVPLRFARKTDDEVGAERESGNSVEGFGEVDVVLGGMLAVHSLEDCFASALDG